MTAIRAAILTIALTGQSASLWAQASDMDIPAAASERLPGGIAVKSVEDGRVYVDRRGLTLYGMDIRAVTGRTGRPFLYCSGDCLAQWEPLLAPAGSTPAPTPSEFGGPQVVEDQSEAAAKDAEDWTIAQGPQGPQWVYKRVHLVFTRKGDRPGSTAYDGQDSYVWNTLKYIAPIPELVAPPNVAPSLVHGGYVLADTQGNLLFTPKAKDCADPCGNWRGFASGMARRGIGQWSVRQGQDQAQWVYRGKPVYRIDGNDPADIPAEGVALTP